MKLDEYLAKTGISQPAFAADIGCTQAAVSRYVSRRRIPRPRLMARIEKVTNGAVTANDFFADEREKAEAAA